MCPKTTMSLLRHNNIVTGSSAWRDVSWGDCGRLAVTAWMWHAAVDSFGTDWKLICNVLLVNNTNLCLISHRFRVYLRHIGQIIAFGGCFFDSLIMGEPWTLDYRVFLGQFSAVHSSEDCRIWPKRTRNITLLCDAQNISIYWTI